MNNLVRSDNAMIGSSLSAGAIQMMARDQFAVSLALVIAVAAFTAMAALSSPHHELAVSARLASAATHAPAFVVPFARPAIASEG